MSTGVTQQKLMWINYLKTYMSCTSYARFRFAMNDVLCILHLIVAGKIECSMSATIKKQQLTPMTVASLCASRLTIHSGDIDQ